MIAHAACVPWLQETLSAALEQLAELRIILLRESNMLREQNTLAVRVLMKYVKCKTTIFICIIYLFKSIFKTTS